jgi:hypothetical protein
MSDLSTPKGTYEERDRVQIVDCREPYEWAAGRVDGSKHLPLNSILAGAGDDTAARVRAASPPRRTADERRPASEPVLDTALGRAAAWGCDRTRGRAWVRGRAGAGACSVAAALRRVGDAARVPAGCCGAGLAAGAGWLAAVGSYLSEIARFRSPPSMSSCSMCTFPDSVRALAPASHIVKGR